ncbi:Galactose-1-phosphate uridylyltransferase [Candidatus Syntrophocurvum alkaliphilum]|uniref:Galactose-1-phosphate uridylyltransferase n=1 Tax=Candidatus Syntrophocurvum alkaliphilum TaxID=2293317 RepID=A0A6I6DC59_9FIRM|nr:DUF4931 domain-containing protein [Candidatus Syntrophocurvum alkaliphilum]QGT98925.1 Galactose-1-phosphate uridylyltransferase [Candidatus Syntrophocurvum alkaliphilum]
MPELRKDMVRNNWVVVATERALKPNDFPINKKDVSYETETSSIHCPFCEGNESYTPPEIFAYRDENIPKNYPGWSVRIIPNKFAAFELTGELKQEVSGVFSSCNGVGHHEVVVETPEHGTEFHEFNLNRIELIINTFIIRYNVLLKDPRIKYIQIYKNRGLFAGASLDHSHSQIVGLPIVPEQNKGLTEYYLENERCLLCDIIEQECMYKKRIVYETELFLVICPYASRFSYEMWVLPKEHREHFGDISENEVKELSVVIKKATSVIVDCLNNASYNFIINTSSVNTPQNPSDHWFVEVIPRLIVPSALEVSTGYYINPAAPEVSAELLRKEFKNID